jgi:hypothetical protein
MTNDIARTYLNLNMLGIACTYLNLNMPDITLSFRFTPPLDVHFKPSIINHRTTSLAFILFTNTSLVCVIV